MGEAVRDVSAANTSNVGLGLRRLFNAIEERDELSGFMPDELEVR